MVKYSCLTCDKSFKQKGHYDFHMNRKTPCKKNEEQVNTIIKKLNVGLFEARSYDDVKTHYDTVLNKDKSTFRSSNDEPTPIGCIEEMLEPIPLEFWEKKDLKILDPCCGNGNFHLVIANKLRLAKNSSILHFNDINVDRLENVKTIFKDPIISNKDFLKEEFDSDYDMIVGNPPYALLMEDGSRASKNHNISSLFIKKSIDCLKDDGYLVYIVPDNWMSLSDRNKFCELLTSYQFVKLSIHKAKYWFPRVGSSFTWFILQKTLGRLPFTVEYLHKKVVHISMVSSQVSSYIPLFYSKYTQSIFRKTVDSGLEKYNVETSSDLHKYTKRQCISSTADDVFKYKLIHTPKQTVWSNRPHKFQDGWKVFISTTDTYNVFVDNCGMTQSIAFIRVDTEEEAKRICSQLLSPLYRFINNACRYGNFNNIRILQKFPISIGDPYVELGITLDEIAYIESHL
jgi:hypothetical protein